ncbi:MAG: hypothetical protein DLM58_19285 [Pseudonocardiales bacterium]|nr:MAG: hypothetical protein DLM58_19285 [Pseudonocardiales bacterium]
MSEPRGPSPAGIRATIGVGVAAVLCCAGPALFAGGALSGIGGLVRSPWMISGGATLVVLAVAYPIVRHRQRRAGNRTDDCCAPLTNRPDGHDTSGPAHQDPTGKRMP